MWQPQVIANYAQMYGIKVEQSGPFIKLKGTIAQFHQFFRTNFMLYKYGGRILYAPEADVKLPATIAPYVGAILGLHNITIATPYVKYLSKAIKNATYVKTEPVLLPVNRINGSGSSRRPITTYHYTCTSSTASTHSTDSASTAPDKPL